MDISSIQHPAPPASTVVHRATLAAREFEVMALTELLKPLLESARAPSIAGGGGAGEAAFTGLLHQEIARSMAQRGGVGIADSVRAALIELQGRNANDAADEHTRGSR